MSCDFTYYGAVPMVEGDPWTAYEPRRCDAPALPDTSRCGMHTLYALNAIKMHMTTIEQKEVEVDEVDQAFRDRLAYAAHMHRRDIVRDLRRLFAEELRLPSGPFTEDGSWGYQESPGNIGMVTDAYDRAAGRLAKENE